MEIQKRVKFNREQVFICAFLSFTFQKLKAAQMNYSCGDFLSAFRFETNNQ